MRTIFYSKVCLAENSRAFCGVRYGCRAWSSTWVQLMVDGTPSPLSWTSLPVDVWTYVYLESSAALLGLDVRVMSSNPQFYNPFGARRRLAQSEAGLGSLKGAVADISLWREPVSQAELIAYVRDENGSVAGGAYPSSLAALYTRSGTRTPRWWAWWCVFVLSCCLKAPAAIGRRTVIGIGVGPVPGCLRATHMSWRVLR